MVRTRASGGVDVSDCAARVVSGRRSCHVRKRDGTLTKVPYIHCNRGCRPLRCHNYAVCGVEFLHAPADGPPPDPPFCQRCICFLASQTIESAETAAAESCPICLEGNLNLYRMPQCTHAFCGPCLGKVLFRNMPPSGAPDGDTLIGALDPILFTGQQPCPLCRRTDNRGPRARHQCISTARRPGADEGWAIDIRTIMEGCGACIS